MKKFIAFAVASVMLFAFACTSIAAGVNAANVSSAVSGIKFNTFTCDTFGIEIGEKKTVLFKTEVETHHKLSEKDVAVYDDSGKTVAYLNDLGKNGDERANDGIYSGRAVITADSIREVNYRVSIKGNTSYTHTIAFHKSVKDIDWDLIDLTWVKIERLEKNLEELGATNEEIVAFVYDYVSGLDYIESVQYDDDLTISFKYDSGIQNIFARYNEDVKSGADAFDLELLEEAVKATDDYIGENTLAVYCPYYGYDSNFTYSYRERAYAMNAVLSFDKLDLYYGAAASVESFKNFDQYGIIMVDSHGAATNGGGYICIPAPGNYDQQDIAEGHLVRSGSTIYLRGTFMQKYCDTLPNTIVYLGICYGMAASNLYAPLLAHGAGFVSGYDESVSFAFDGQIMNKFHDTLVKTNPATNDLYTVKEAYTITVNALGSSTDPYTSQKAKFIYRGNENMHARTHKVPVESVKVTPGEVTLHHNNSAQLSVEVLPLDAIKYTLEWSSENPEIATVTQNGLVTAKQTDGTAKIICTVTDFALGENVVLTAECLVTVDGPLAVTGLELKTDSIEVYTHSSYKLEARVLPYDASNQTLLYESSNEEIVTVSADGIVTGHKVGVAILTVTTQDGGFTGKVVVSVKEGGLDAAANAPTGKLSFTLDSSYPWVAEAVDNRFAAVSSNVGVGNTASMMELNAGKLPQGAQLVFEWKVSSEKNWDKLRFFINGSLKAEISGETDWAVYTFIVPSEGEYRFTWSYLKDMNNHVGNDRGYVDNVDIIIPGTVHTVQFLSFSGEVISTQQVPHGEAAVLPAEPKELGYIFMGWSVPTSEVRSDLVVEPLFLPDPEYVPVYYTVTFVDYDDTVLFVDTVEESKAATPPDDPVREGHKFVGWDKDFSCVTSDMTVKAQYVMYGDANGDGQVNTGDAIMVLIYMVRPIELTEHQKIAYDFNLDNQIGTGDAVAILKAVIS